jgi:hypothetical protein
VIQKFQSSQNLLPTASHEGNNVIGTEKTVPVDEPDDLAVALLKLHGCNDGGAVESWKA